ncbi:glucan 1,3-beta-glucosidase [Exophiala viscosa]|uniref:Glucan 1,3-beta-glucosidase n=1 Tax=Exophiala viscosa TaxID=2486360 RepID=A0AAN6E1M9_9EURO|nr:glucan 1,3-beta-glucosidase [Exophiala viscosa]
MARLAKLLLLLTLAFLHGLAQDTTIPYIVRPGDTAYALAIECGVNLNDVIAANPTITSWTSLQPDQTIQLPSTANCPWLVSSGAASQVVPSSITSTCATTTFTTVVTSQASSASGVTGGQTYTVVAGDTAYNIAARFGISLAALEVANSGIVTDWNLLQIGITLQIPPVIPSTASAYSATISTGYMGTALTSPSPSAASTTLATSPSGYVALTLSSAASASVAIPSSSIPTGYMGTPPSSPTPLTPSVSELSQVTGALAVRNLDLGEGIESPRDVYNFYSGDGSVEQGWPPISSWLSFNAMFRNVEPYIGQGCVDGVPANSPSETDNIRDSIIAVANQSYMDPRFILAVVMQESNGCVRVVSTAGGNDNPGLMQSFEGTGSCDSNGMPVFPCPPSVIRQMIVDGTAAPVQGATLVSALNKAASLDNCEPAQAFYRAARLYNSGLNSLPADGDLGGDPGATLCYSSDIANRLLGWVNGAKQC